MTFNPDNPLEHALPHIKGFHGEQELTTRDGNLVWEQGSKYHLTSRCGYYSVAKVFVNRVSQFQAWFSKTGAQRDFKTPPELLGVHNFPELAKAQANQHSKARK